LLRFFQYSGLLALSHAHQLTGPPSLAPILDPYTPLLRAISLELLVYAHYFPPWLNFHNHMSTARNNHPSSLHQGYKTVSLKQSWKISNLFLVQVFHFFTRFTAIISANTVALVHHHCYLYFNFQATLPPPFYEQLHIHHAGCQLVHSNQIRNSVAHIRQPFGLVSYEF